MNISDVINDIKMSLGLETIALPFNKPTEVVLQEIIKMSVRTFSQFKPQIREGYESIKNLKSPVQYAEAEMASSQYQNAEAATNAFTVGTPFVGFGSYYPQDILNATTTGAAINKYAGVTSRPQTSKWLGYNKIQLFDFPEECLIHFVVKCDHDLSLETIPVSCRESFIELATLDVKRTLFNLLKNMNNVGSAFKEIQLRIDDWSGAEDARNALIERWTNTFHFDEIDLIQFF